MAIPTSANQRLKFSDTHRTLIIRSTCFTLQTEGITLMFSAAHLMAELLNFFNEALSINRVDGSTILENGDVVIMDNGGFHHGHFTEAVLRNILNEHGVHLLFQPAYSPHLNTCQFCFHPVKCYLKQNSSLTADETEIVIGEAMSKISPANSIAYFRKCGYV